jgi:hypothetical protein
MAHASELVKLRLETQYKDIISVLRVFHSLLILSTNRIYAHPFSLHASVQLRALCAPRAGAHMHCASSSSYSVV